MPSKTHSNLNYLLNQRQEMLQFHLLKYLKYENMVKFMLVSKNADRVCDVNKYQNYSEKHKRYLMNVIVFQNISQNIIQETFDKIDSLKNDLANFEEYGIKE